MRDRAVYQAAYREAHRDNQRAYMAAYRKANQERYRAQIEAWAKANPDKRRATHAAYHKANPERSRAGSQRRRAWIRGREVEQFTDAEIFNRDGWVCGLCGDPIDRTLRWPDPLSASLDHILPLSRGGNHTRSNVQPAHLVCNQSKSNRTEVPA